MRLKQLLSFLPLAFLAACSTLQNSEITTSERGDHRGKTLADVYSYVLSIASLPSAQINKVKLEAITGTTLNPREGFYDGNFMIDHSLSIHLQLAQHSEASLYFIIEFRPALTLPMNLKQDGTSYYTEEIDRLINQVILNNCIARDRLFDALFKNGWTLFETNLSSSLHEEEGNFYLSSEDGKYITLTINSNCLSAFSISNGTKHRAFSGIPLPKK